MTHATYTQQALSRYNLPRLRRIATELGVTPAGNKTLRQTWIDAIITHQSTQIQKLDEQTAAQSELDSYIADQTLAIPPEPLTPVEISFYNHEYYVGNEVVAAITHDDDLTQPWLVIVNGIEKFRANTWNRCYRFIQWHHQDGTLNEAVPAQTETLAEEPCTTGNEIMAQIFTECEKYGFEILDDGIYRNDMKLGEVGQTDGCWWFTRAEFPTQQRIPCDSALDAVYWLSMVDTLPHAELADYEEMLDRPFEMLTNEEWGQLQQLVTA